jgi:hypothetical protein
MMASATIVNREILMRHLGHGFILSIFALLNAGCGHTRLAEPIWLSGDADYRELHAHLLTPQKPVLVADNVLGNQAVMPIEIIVNDSGRVVMARPHPINPDWKVPVQVANKFYSEATAEALNWRFQPFARNAKTVSIRCHTSVRVERSEDAPTIHVPFPKLQDWASLRFTLERGSCFGPCPQYKVEIHGDGLVLFTETGGKQTGSKGQDQISRQTVADLLAAFQKADYFSLNDKYQWNGHDAPTYVTSVSFDGHSKSVIDCQGKAVGMPHVVTELEKMIDKIGATEKWIGTPSARGSKKYLPKSR